MLLRAGLAAPQLHRSIQRVPGQFPTLRHRLEAGEHRGQVRHRRLNASRIGPRHRRFAPVSDLVSSGSEVLPGPFRACCLPSGTRSTPGSTRRRPLRRADALPASRCLFRHQPMTPAQPLRSNWQRSHARTTVGSTPRGKGLTAIASGDVAEREGPARRAVTANVHTDHPSPVAAAADGQQGDDGGRGYLGSAVRRRRPSTLHEFPGRRSLPWAAAERQRSCGATDLRELPGLQHLGGDVAEFTVGLR